MLVGRSGCVYRPAQIIYNVGDEASSVYYLYHGLVKLSAISEDGKEIILDVYKPGEIFGESCLCEETRSEIASTMEPSKIIDIKLEILFELLQVNQRAMMDFISIIVQRLARTHEVIRELSFDNLSSRLAKVLLRLADQFGQETERGTELAHYFTHEEFSQMVSVRRELISTELGRMRRRGELTYTRKGKLIINRDALMAHVEEGDEQQLGTRGQTDGRAAGHKRDDKAGL